MEKAIEKAGVLMEALPYIQRFHGKLVVVKCGGTMIANEGLKTSTMRDVVLMKFVGMKPVVVHGGGPLINEALGKIGKKTDFVNGMRVTDGQTLDVVRQVLADTINKEMAAMIAKAGGAAVTINGHEKNMVKARKIQMEASGEESPTDIGFVGEVEELGPAFLKLVRSNKHIPVVAPLGSGSGSEIYNINADAAAGEIAARLKAEKLVLLTDVPGIMRDMKDAQSLISTLTVSELDRLIAERVIHGGMIPKVKACERALAGGVKKAHIIDGRITHSLLLEIFTDRGVGTEIVCG
jgi:acetylglutamate kinase